MPPEPGNAMETSISGFWPVLGFLGLAGLAAWLSYRALFRDRKDFAGSVSAFFTSGLTATLRGELRKNLDGTFRFVIWIFLSAFGLLIASGILGLLTAWLSPAH